MHRTFFFLFLSVILRVVPLCAQVHFVPFSQQRHIPVSSYMGAETEDRFSDFRLQLEMPEAYYADWSLSVRLAAPIVAVGGGISRNGKSFPADKIALRWTVGSDQAGANAWSAGEGRKIATLREAAEVMLVHRHRIPIASEGEAYADLRLHGSVAIAPGAYLDGCLSADAHAPITYSLPLVFTLYDGQMRTIGSHRAEYELELQPRLADALQAGLPPEYALSVDPAAQNGVLNFHTVRDYTEGIPPMVVNNALKIHAGTDFEVRVQVLQEALTDGSDGTLPLDVLSLRFSGGRNAKPIAGTKIALSRTERTAFQGTSSDRNTPQYYHLHYEAKLSPAQLANLKPGRYTVSLMYQILPR